MARNTGQYKKRSKILSELKGIKREIFFEENSYKRMVANKRKSDAHKKILLGIMFHLTNLDKFQGKDDTILLGILEDAANKIHSPDGERHTNYFRSIGEHNFESNLKGWKRKNRSEEPI